MSAAIVEQPLHAARKIERFYAVEACLIGVVPFGFARCHCVCPFLQRIAIAGGWQSQDLLFHLPRMLAGDFDMPVFVAPDIAGQGIPDHGKLLAGAPPIPPARQDDFRIDRYLDAGDMAAAV